MMSRRALLAAALLGLVAPAACVQASPPAAVAVPSYALEATPVQCDTSFRVHNRSNGTVEQLYFSHSSQSNWGVDQLGQNVLAPGKSAGYRAARAGNYDFRVVWSNGRSAELRQVNICAVSNIVVTNGGLNAN